MVSTQRRQLSLQQQNQKDTIVEFSSCFDMGRKINLEERIELLKNLHSIYGVSDTHHVTDEACGEFTDWDISVVYQPKIDCTIDDLVDQFKTLWPVLNKEWISWKNKEKH